MYIMYIEKIIADNNGLSHYFQAMFPGHNVLTHNNDQNTLGLL